MKTDKEKKTAVEKFPLTDEQIKEHGNPSFQTYMTGGWKCTAQMCECSCSPYECNNKCKHYPKDLLHFYRAVGLSKDLGRWHHWEMVLRTTSNSLGLILDVIKDDWMSDEAKLMNIKRYATNVKDDIEKALKL